jgi:hypothetical protein
MTQISQFVSHVVVCARSRSCDRLHSCWLCCDSDHDWASIGRVLFGSSGLRHFCAAAVVVGLSGGPLDGPIDVGGGDGGRCCCVPLLWSAVPQIVAVGSILALAVVEAS